MKYIKYGNFVDITVKLPNLPSYEYESSLSNSVNPKIINYMSSSPNWWDRYKIALNECTTSDVLDDMFENSFPRYFEYDSQKEIKNCKHEVDEDVLVAIITNDKCSEELSVKIYKHFHSLELSIMESYEVNCSILNCLKLRLNIRNNYALRHLLYEVYFR